MKHIHVCLISEQTIPNILGIFYFKPEEVLFITTEQMLKREKTEAIVNTLKRLGLNIPFFEIVVREDSIYDCHRKIAQWMEKHEEDNFTVNLTCGTKIMSIATYEIFKDYGSKMIYIPIPKNEFFEVYPLKKLSEPQPLPLRLGVIEYLTAYSLRVTNEAKLNRYKEESEKRKALTNWIVTNYNSIEGLLSEFYKVLQKSRNVSSFDLTIEFPISNELQRDFLKAVGFNISGRTISKRLSRSEIRYLTGGWLEEYVFNSLNSIKGRGIDDVVMNVEIENIQGNKNEFDVMFTKDNALYFVECKSLSPEDEITKSSLYKIGALQKEFGLRVQSFFVTTSPHIIKDGQIRQSVRARAEQFKTEIIKPDEIVNFETIIRKKLKIMEE